MKSKKLDANKHDLSHLSTIQRLKSLQHQFDHAEMNLACIRVARKQSNFDLASRLIVSQFNRLKLSTSSDGDVASLFDPSVAVATSLCETFRFFEAELNQTNTLLSDKMKMALVECEREACKLIHSIEETNNSNLNGEHVVFNSIQMLAESVFRFTDDFKVL